MTVPHTHKAESRQRRRRTLALTATGAMVVATLGVLNTGTANAEVRSATTGSFTWGIKRSLFTYHFNHAGTTQHLTQGDGAVAGPVDEDASVPGEPMPLNWTFPLTSGSYDTTSNQFTAQYGGYVLMTEDDDTPSTGPTGKSPFKYYKFANPKIVLDFTAGTKKVFVDVSEAATATGTPTTQTAVEFANLTIASANAPVSDVVSYTNIVTRLAQGGVDIFTDETATPPSAFYPLDTALDRTAMSLTAPSGPPPSSTPTPTPTPTSTPPASTPTPTPPASGGAIQEVKGSTFEWAWNDYIQKQSQGGCFFMSAGATNPTTAAAYNATNYSAVDGDVQILKAATATPTQYANPTFATRCDGVTDATNGLNQKLRWTNGAGFRDPSTGAAVIKWKGLVQVNYNNQIRIKDPVLTVSPAGVATLVAQIGTGTSSTWTQATLADLTGVNTGQTGSVVKNPVFDQRKINMPVNSATEVPTAAVCTQLAGLTPAQPCGAWPQSFVNAAGSAIAAFFYSTGTTAAGLQKPPKAITFNYGTFVANSYATANAQQLAVAVAGPGGPGVGDFSWEILQNDTVTLGNPQAYAGNLVQYTGTLKNIRVTDARSTSNVPGTWEVTGLVSDFQKDPSTIFGGYHLGWTPAVLASDPGANAVAGNEVLPGFSPGEGLSSAATLARGGVGASDTTGTIGAGLTMRIPASTTAGNYAATLTLTGIAI